MAGVAAALPRALYMCACKMRSINITPAAQVDHNLLFEALASLHLAPIRRYEVVDAAGRVTRQDVFVRVEAGAAHALDVTLALSCGAGAATLQQQVCFVLSQVPVTDAASDQTTMECITWRRNPLCLPLHDLPPASPLLSKGSQLLSAVCLCFLVQVADMGVNVVLLWCQCGACVSWCRWQTWGSMWCFLTSRPSALTFQASDRCVCQG